jgi:hypothetical protein
MRPAYQRGNESHTEFDEITLPFLEFQKESVAHMKFEII